MSQGQLRELADILTWENLPMDAKLTKLLEGNRIFEMPVERRWPSCGNCWKRAGIRNSCGS